MNQKGHLIEKNGFELNKSEVPVRKGEPLALEIESFLNCVKQATTPKTDGHFGKSALEIALSITRKIESSGKGNYADGEYVFPDPRRFSRFIDYSRRSIRG